MPPKQQKGTRRGKGEESRDEPLQAVIVADTFETKFAPFSLERPRCLMPLANVPLIEFTLEYLARVGVEEVFLYAGAHTEQVETYLEASKWKTNSSPFQEVTMIKCQALSVGDIMRDLDSRQIVHGDFLCVSGDIVSDFPISKALKIHKQRREKDKNAIMSMLLRERNDSDHRHRHQTVPTFVIDPTKDRCLHYEESIVGAPFGAHIDPETLRSPEIDIRQDLIDCRIDICTPDVLSLWSDNFDNQKPRKDFLFGVIKDYELNGKTIHTYLIEGYYANRVDDPAAYASVTYDLQHGIASSLALDNNVSGTRFERQRNDIAREDHVIIQRPSRLEGGTIVGTGTSIGAGTCIKKTIIGQRCQIGKNAELNSAFIWDDVTIGTNVRVTRAIIGSEAFIGDNSVIEEGALISFGARIPAGSHITAGKRVTSSSTFGQNGALKEGADEIVYDSDEEQPEYDSSWASSFYQRAELNDSVSSLGSNASEVSEQPSKDGSRSMSFATHTSDEDTLDRFQHDTAAILVQRMQAGSKADDMQSELMGLRFSAVADGMQVMKAVITALTKHIQNEVTAGATPMTASEKAVSQYRTLIRRPNAEQTTEEQVGSLMEAQADLAKRPDGARIIVVFFKDLYNLDVFEEESFLVWWVDDRSKAEGLSAMRDAAKPFIDFLKTADEESESEEESDDD